MMKRERNVSKKHSMNRIGLLNELTSSGDPTVYVPQLNTRRFNPFLYSFRLTIPPPHPATHHSAPDVLYGFELHSAPVSNLQPPD
jgi:hypothetical protein